jgi:endonuclease/exonuclease/phosphatase family metal-dependent hydrolase
MKIATWNLNHRAGTTRFRPEAARAAGSLEADVLVLTEYFPKTHHDEFVSELRSLGWKTILMSKEPKERANRALLASRVAVEPESVSLPSFDEQQPSNVVVGRVSESGLRVVGLRIPYYVGEHVGNFARSWDWLERISGELQNTPTIILGDLNVKLKSTARRGGDHFRRMIGSGWTRAVPTGEGSCYRGAETWTEIYHALCSPRSQFTSAKYVTQAGGYSLAGTADSISDHAALVVDCEVTS